MAIAFVDTGSGSGSGSSTTLDMSAINLVTSNSAFAGTKWETNSPNLTSITDTAGNTYSLLTSLTYAGTARLRGGYTLNAAANASNVVRFTWDAGATFRQGATAQFSGVSGSGFDQQNTNSGNSGTATSGNITTTQNDEVVMFCAAAFTATTFSSETINGTTSNSRYEGSDFEFHDLIVSSTFTGGGSSALSPSGQWGGIIASFKATAGGSVTSDIDRGLGRGLARGYARGLG